jgi:acetoin utilization deacetylase AcuC-like enzyme
MKTFYSPAHLSHDPLAQFEAGVLVPAVEIPARAERVKAEIEARKIGPVLAPTPFDDAPILRVHDAGLVKFLGQAYAEWTRRYGANVPPMMPSDLPARGLHDKREAHEGDIEAKLASYAFSADTPILPGTWQAAREAVNVALSAAQVIRAGDKSAFALTRPPGHHASSDLFGGFCYLNNIAIAAQWLADAGLRPAILDVDYHHGNGTQSIFYGRGDVFFCSLHADPRFAYPHFMGFADEHGEGAGIGANLNLPLPANTDWALYEQALARGLAAVEAFGPDVLLVSLGLDTYIHDPIASFRLKPADYLRLGEKIATLGRPTMFVFEGGYAIEALGEITANVLEGFASK